MMMRRERRALLCLLLCVSGWLLPCNTHAARSPEELSFSAARALFDDHQYNLAETNLSRFLASFTNSPNRNYAILYLARARLAQSNYTGAILLLTSALPQAGPLADEYAFWTASGRLANGDYTRAAQGFADFVGTYTNSPRRLEAAYNEAEANAKLENWPRVTELLQATNSAFRQLASAAPDKSSVMMRGAMLLGESLLAQNRPAEGEKIVATIDTTALEPEWQWRRQYLLCRLELAAGHADLALQNSTNLLDSTTGPRHLAASRFLRGEILEAVGRPTDALQVYTNNLSDDVPGEEQRQALLKTVELTLQQYQTQDAVQLLESYVAVRTNGPALDLARLSLGELYLKVYFNPLPVDKSFDPTGLTTNFLQEALRNFNNVLTNFPESTLLPHAHLDRGWCYWAQTNMPDARADFQAAADQLRFSPQQAVARFKLADAEFYQRDYNNALSNYNLLLQQYAQVATVTNALFDQALYQILEANLARGDQQGATDALQKILAWYPDSLFGDRGQLLIGQSRKYDYAMARKAFRDLLQRSPKTPLLPEVEYQIARTYEQEGNWPEAMRQYDQWMAQHATNSPVLLPKVQYSRALVTGKSGAESNALVLFTNFVANFPTNTLAPWAQNWVADYYFNRGDNLKAEESYQVLFQKFPNAGDLGYYSRLMAGRAALARQDPTEARGYFRDLVNMTNAPSSIVSEGYFALGDTILQQFINDPSNTTNLDDAISAYSTQTNGAPTNAMAAQAYGLLGNCYMQWADAQWESKHDPKLYASAVQMYQTVANFPSTNVDISTRSEGEVALGRIGEKLGHAEDALVHYCKVLYESEPDQFDPYWIEQAGKAAGRLYERQKQWDKAVKVYQRVGKAIPSLRASLEKAIINAQSDSDKSRN